MKISHAPKRRRIEIHDQLHAQINDPGASKTGQHLISNYKCTQIQRQKHLRPHSCSQWDTEAIKTTQVSCPSLLWKRWADTNLAARLSQAYATYLLVLALEISAPQFQQALLQYFIPSGLRFPRRNQIAQTWNPTSNKHKHKSQA